MSEWKENANRRRDARRGGPSQKVRIQKFKPKGRKPYLIESYWEYRDTWLLQSRYATREQAEQALKMLQKKSYYGIVSKYRLTGPGIENEEDTQA